MNGTSQECGKQTMILQIRHPTKIVSPFLSTAPLQYVPKMLLTQVTIECFINNKTKNALHNDAVILNYIGRDPISHGLSNYPFVNVL